MSVGTAAYRRAPGVRCLRSLAFTAYPDVPAALADPECIVPPPDEAAMLAFDGGEIFELSLVAAFIWDLLDGTRTGDELAAAVRARFGPDVEGADGDVARLLEALAEHDLVSVASGR